jgi:hypothetical protein
METLARISILVSDVDGSGQAAITVEGATVLIRSYPRARISNSPVRCEIESAGPDDAERLVSQFGISNPLHEALDAAAQTVRTGPIGQTIHQLAAAFATEWAAIRSSSRRRP